MSAWAKLIEVLVMEGTALVLFAFAYAIGVKGKMFLIAGYNERTAGRVRDKRGLARVVARLCILVGLASALMPLATHLWGDSRESLAGLIGGYGGFIVGAILFTMLQAREYVSQEDRNG
jgi:hypothetical protein